MGNEESISQLVSPEAFAQVEKLIKMINEAVENQKRFIQLAAQAHTATSRSKSPADITNNSKAMNDYANKAIKEYERIKKAEIDLRNVQAKNQAKFEADLKRQMAAEQKRADQAEKNSLRSKKAAERERLAELKLETDRQRAFDRFQSQELKRAAADERARKRIEEQSRAYSRLTAELRENKKAAQDIGVVYGVNSKQFKAANAEVQKLQAQLNMVDGAIRGKSGKASGVMTNLNSALGGYVSAFAVFAGLKRVVTLNAEISDSLSDVQRTAQLTGDEANNLAEQLKKINTRTSLKGLIDIAAIGGQLGIAKDDLAGFTKAVDGLAVTLAKEIPGGAEAVASSLGKINGVFKVQQEEGTNTEQALNKTGSAILALGQVGLATGEYLQDFTLRTAGIAKSANIALPTILAYGAVLEESGTSAEVAGTALNKLIGSLSSKREQFFKIAQIADSSLTLKEFTNIINTDANKALQMFFKGLNSGGKDLTTFSDLLDTLKIKTGPTKNAIVALAQNQDTLNSRIALGTKEYNKGTLAIEQFAIKNDNLAGSLEKVGNEFTKITTGGRISALFKGIADGLANATSKFNRLVNSDSWKEFWIRINTTNQNGEDIINFKDAYNSTKKRNDDNQQFIFNGDKGFSKDKLKNLGPIGFNSYLEKLKKTADQALDAYARYEAAVNSGRLEEDKVTVKHYKTNFERAQSYYLELLSLQKEFGFNQTKAAPVAGNTSGVLGGGDGKVNTDKDDLLIDRAKREQENFKRIAEDEKLNLQVRLDAIDKFQDASIKLAELTAQKELKAKDLTESKIKSIKENSLAEQDEAERKSAEMRVAIETAAEKQLAKLLIEGDKRQQESGKLRLNERATDLLKQQELLSGGYDVGLLKLQESLKKGEISEQEYQVRKFVLTRDFTNQSTDLEIKGVQDIIDIKKEAGIDISEDQKKLSELTRKRIKDDVNFEIDQKEKLIQKERELVALKKQFSQEVSDLAIAAVNSTFEHQKNKIADELNEVDKKKAIEIENVNDSILSEEEKANRIAIIEAKAQSTREELERRQSELEQRRARFEKIAAVGKIAISTAVSVAKISAEAAASAAIPIFGPALAAAALAQIPWIIGIGLAQTASILATPIPKYKMGTPETGHPNDGPAMVGDGYKHELQINPDGSFQLTPDRPTMTYLKKGTKIIGGDKLERMVKAPPLDVFSDAPSEVFSDNRIVESLDKVVKSVKENAKTKHPSTLITKSGIFRVNLNSNEINKWLRANKL